MDWTKEEVVIIVADYFEMFKLERESLSYNKSAHRRNLSPFLINRNKAIEHKHRNISGVLASMGYPYIKGYKPLFRYQQMLEDEIVILLDKNKSFFKKEFQKFVQETEDLTGNNIDFERIIDAGPQKSKFKFKEPSFLPLKINYLEKEQNNRLLGEKGEQLVYDYEKWRLLKAGKYNLADSVEWVSKQKGDGLGYDILSKNDNGTDRFIEVKTTKLAKETPIYFSYTELAFAKGKGKGFYLYRLFNFKEKPQLFIKQGNYESYCQLRAQSYKGFF